MLRGSVRLLDPSASEGKGRRGKNGDSPFGAAVQEEEGERASSSRGKGVRTLLDLSTTLTVLAHGRRKRGASNSRGSIRLVSGRR